MTGHLYFLNRHYTSHRRAARLLHGGAPASLASVCMRVSRHVYEIHLAGCPFRSAGRCGMHAPSSPPRGPPVFLYLPSCLHFLRRTLERTRPAHPLVPDYRHTDQALFNARSGTPDAGAGSSSAHGYMIPQIRPSWKRTFPPPDLVPKMQTQPCAPFLPSPSHHLCQNSNLHG